MTAMNVVQQGSYYETSLAFDGEALATAVRLVDSIAGEDYVLYESDEGWSLGIGVHTHLAVYPEWTVLNDNGDRQVFHNTELSRTLDTALASLSVKDWRAYGIANFELAMYNHGVELADRETCLVSVFIPKSEVRYYDSNHSVLIRALDPQVLDDLKRRLDAVMTSEIPARFRNPVVLSREELPEIDIHGSEKYMAMVSGALQEIRSHQYRKVILSRKVPISRKIDMSASYVVGRRANTPARSYLLNVGGFKAAGFSPETVVVVDDEGTVTTTPLAGTRAIGEDILEELRLREELVSDSKEIAEHAISVYVAFDEMAMVCETASVAVANFMVVSRRGTVQHLASRLTGKLLEHYSPWHAFHAIFPAVTASGVPKREAIHSIGRFEPEPRGLYSGCVLICDQSGKFDSALVLRSFFQQGGQTWLQAGAGIMNMSNPTRELEETREKLRSCSYYLVPSDV